MIFLKHWVIINTGTINKCTLNLRAVEFLVNFFLSQKKWWAFKLVFTIFSNYYIILSALSEVLPVEVNSQIIKFLHVDINTY